MSSHEPAPSDGGGFIAFPFVRIRLDLSYDGTDFLGWAIQPHGRTVQGEVERALATIIGTACRLTVAGRTDSGVHARAQVAHVDLPAKSWSEHGERLLQRLNGLLPPDVRVLALVPAPNGFDARFSALARHYIYRIEISSTGADPLSPRARIHRTRSLDVEAMRQAAASLLGEHDFLAFCKPREGATTIRTLLRCDVVPTDWGVELHVSADAFCHSMVRAIAGALLAVGEHRRPVEWVAGLVDAARKPSDVAVLPAQGLTLERVDYPTDADLASRAEMTRARRISGME
jgi:tRNA pseudouridine38-40 synthase